METLERRMQLYISTVTLPARLVSHADMVEFCKRMLQPRLISWTKMPVGDISTLWYDLLPAVRVVPPELDMEYTIVTAQGLRLANELNTELPIMRLVYGSTEYFDVQACDVM